MNHINQCLQHGDHVAQITDFASLGRGIDAAVRHTAPAMVGAWFAAAGCYVHGRAHHPFTGVRFQQ